MDEIHFHEVGAVDVMCMVIFRTMYYNIILPARYLLWAVKL